MDNIKLLVWFYIISVEKSIRLSLLENKIMQTFSDTFLWTWTFWRACDGLLPCNNHCKTICFQFHSWNCWLLSLST